MSDEVRTLAPGFTHVVIEAHGLVVGPSTEAGRHSSPTRPAVWPYASTGTRRTRTRTWPPGARPTRRRGVARRRWNWRQGPRTRLTERTTSAAFLPETLAPMPVAEAASVGAELAEPLAKFSPGARVEVRAPEPAG